MKKLLKTLAALCISLPGVWIGASQAAQIDYGDRVRYVRDIEYRGEAVYEGSNKRYTITIAMEDKIKPVIENIETFAAQAQSMVSSVYGKAYGDVRDSVDSAGGKLSSFNLDFGEFPTQLSLELIGRPNGTVLTKIGPLALDFSFSAKHSLSSHIWSGRASANTSLFYIIGNYNVHSGYMSNVGLQNFDFQVNIDIDSSLPIVSYVLRNIGNDIEDELESSVPGVLNALSSQQFKLMDVNMALPSNEYVTASGIDVAGEVRDAINNLVNGERIKFSFKREFLRYSLTHQNPFGGQEAHVKKHELFIELGQNSSTTFKIWDIPLFGWTTATACNWGECFPPNSTVDLANTNEGWFDIDVVNLGGGGGGSGPGVPSGASCTWRSSPSYGNGMGGEQLIMNIPPLGPAPIP